MEKSRTIFKKENKEQIDLPQENSKYTNFILKFDILKNNSFFIQFSNKYYNGNSIEIIGMIRMIIMFFIVYGNNFLLASRIYTQNDVFNIFMTFLKRPLKNFFNKIYDNLEYPLDLQPSIAFFIKT